MYLPTQPPLVERLFEKKKQQTFITQQNCDGSYAGCFTYGISWILTQKTCEAGII